MKISSLLFKTFILGLSIGFASFSAQAVDCEHQKRIGMSQGCSTSGGTDYEAPSKPLELTACENAVRQGMSQGCSTSDGTGHVATADIPQRTNCENAVRQGMSEGCSTTGGTGTSITHTAADGNVGTCRQSVRAGLPAPVGCGDQTPIPIVVPK